MITKTVLDAIFDRSFANGNFMGQLDKLDALGVIDRRKMIATSIKTLEQCDILEEKLQLLSDKIDLLEEKLAKNERVTTGTKSKSDTTL